MCLNININININIVCGQGQEANNYVSVCLCACLHLLSLWPFGIVSGQALRAASTVIYGSSPTMRSFLTVSIPFSPHRF